MLFFYLFFSQSYDRDLANAARIRTYEVLLMKRFFFVHLVHSGVSGASSGSHPCDAIRG